MKNLKWIYFIARRFSSIDRRSRSSTTSVMPSIGIGLGVMALIVIMSVMNGFQMGSIDSIVELSSWHIRVTPKEGFDYDKFELSALSLNQVKSVTPFYEAQGLLVGRSGQQSAALIRAIPPDIDMSDEGFKRELRMYMGTFDLNMKNTVVLGWSLAQSLGVGLGDKINILALSGNSDVDLFSDDRQCMVTGIFACGYSEINSLYAFIPYETGKAFLGDEARHVYGIKVSDKNNEMRVLNQISKIEPNATYESWRSFNRSFYGALRIEKNVLMMLVILIFLVVGVNIFNGMRRMVFERKEEICVLSALGGSGKNIQRIFISKGFLIGVCGAIPGLILGLLLSVRIDAVFTLIGNVTYYAQLFFTMLFTPENAAYVRQNSVYLFYARIPARVFFAETVYITLFGIFAAVFAAWIASRKTLTLSIAEVLRDE